MDSLINKIKGADLKKYLYVFYCVGVLFQNILACKNIDFFAFSVTAGILVSPLVFICQDISSEVYGYKRTRNLILLGYLCNFLFVILASISIALPYPSFYANQEAFAAIFGTTPRIVFASFIAYLVGSLVNSKVMCNLKKYAEKNLFIRAISSTVVGQFFDNFLFSFIAFYGVMNIQELLLMALGATFLETVYEVIFFPVTKRCIRLFGYRK